MSFEKCYTDKINIFINSIQKKIFNVLQTSDDEYERKIALKFAQEIVEYSNSFYIF